MKSKPYLNTQRVQSPQLDSSTISKSKKNAEKNGLSLYFANASNVFGFENEHDKRSPHNKSYLNTSSSNSNSCSRKSVKSINQLNLGGTLTSRTSWVQQSYPKTMNYVNLSYQKIKSLNTNISIQDSVIENDQNSTSRVRTSSKREDSKIRLSFIINQNYYGNEGSTPTSRRVTVTSANQSDQGQLHKVNEDSIENNKVSLYNISYDHNMILNNIPQQQKQQKSEQDLLKLQLSPIIRKYTMDNTNKISTPTANSNFISSSTKHQNYVSKKYSKSKVEETENNLAKQQQLETQKKVKISTEHAFHYSSGRARLKNKRQMFSPCQSARYECKVQFENKYLIKTAFIQPNDNNKEIQMVPVDLIQIRRKKLVQQLENLQKMKEKLAEQEISQENQESQFESKQVDNSQTKRIKEKTMLQLGDFNIEEEAEENDKEDSIELALDQHTNHDCTQNQGDHQHSHQHFSEKINQLKMLDNYNSMMKGIKNQLHDIDEIVSKEKQNINSSNILNSSQSQANLTLNKTPKIGDSFQHKSQIKATHIQKGESQNNSNLNSNLSHSNLNYSKANSSQQSVNSKKIIKRLEEPFCNSNEILSRYSKEKVKATSQKQILSPRYSEDNSILKGVLSPKYNAITSTLTQNQNSQKKKFIFSPLMLFESNPKDVVVNDFTLDLDEKKLSNESNITARSKTNELIKEQSPKKSPFSYFKEAPPINAMTQSHIMTSLEISRKGGDNRIKKSISTSQIAEKQPSYLKEMQINVDTSIMHSKKELIIETPTNEQMKISLNQNIKSPTSNQENSFQVNHQKKQSTDQEFLSALLAQQMSNKRQSKKPISQGFKQRRVILQRKSFSVQKTKKRYNMKKVKKSLLDFLQKLKKSKLQLNEFVEKKSEIFMEKPLQRIGSFVFFKAVKHNNLAGVKRTLEKCRYFVFDFDQKRQTCAHKAAKKGYTAMLEYLISEGTDLEFKDIAGRKPLYYAIKQNHIDCVRLILQTMANPWGDKQADYNQLTQDKEEINQLLKQYRKLHLVLMFTPFREKQTLVENTVKMTKHH